MSDNPEKKLEEVIRRDGRYPREAFAFLHDALARAVKEVYGDQAGDEGSRHVTGGQLCEALRDEALERWGLLAPTVLGRWNIRETMDFGNMVYLLTDHGLMKKKDTDSIDDFRNVYDFAVAFGPDKVFRGNN
ncbi:MAG: Minf_1886 family protein [Planctomycetota bacterium]|nr:Minf_1886 family protein [Planctomycetota bacterium]